MDSGERGGEAAIPLGHRLAYTAAAVLKTLPTTLLLLLFSLLGLAHADDGSANSQAPVEVTVWHAYRGEERAAVEAQLHAYSASHPGVQVTPLAIPYDSFFSKLEAAAPRGNGPDLFIAAHERIGTWAATGLLKPLPPGQDISDFHPSTVAAMTWQDQLYGLPLAYKCLALFVNRALVQQPPTTTDQLEAMLPGLTGDKHYGLAYVHTDAYFHAPWMHGFGGGVFDKTKPGAPVALDQPGNAEALAWVVGLQDRGLLPEEPTSALVTELFNQGRAAMVISGPWFLGEISPDIDFQIAPLPIVSATGLPAAPYLTVDGAFVSAFAKHPAQALAVAAFLASPGPALRRAIDGRQSVSSLTAAADPAVAADPVLSAFRDQLDAAVPMPNRPEMQATWEPQARALRRVTRHALTPQAAVIAAQQEYDIVSRPPPPQTSPVPYLVVVGLALVGSLLWFGPKVWAARQQIRSWRFAYGYIAPAAVAMGLLVVVPFLVGACVSLFAHRDGQFTFVGMANFLDIILARDWPLTSPLSFWFTLAVTVLWTASNVFLHVAIGLGLAMMLREPWLKLRGVYRVLLILPWAVPNYITALIWKGMFHRQFGAINGFLEWIGVGAVSWFSQFSTAFAANLTTNTWLGFPFMMVVTLGALQSIPRDLEQAAAVDGANAWQRFRHITLPLLKPALLPAVILGSVWTFNMFNIIYLVSAGEPDGSTEILISEAYRWAFTRGHRYGYASAYAVLIFFVLLGYSRLMNRVAGQKVL
ncbi:MAG: extracellular solute-binding protein [Oligoflexia bacterium]|nr:extracellular solute-binding protein [Oligoflexia bacterium]